MAVARGLEHAVAVDALDELNGSAIPTEACDGSFAPPHGRGIRAEVFAEAVAQMRGLGAVEAVHALVDCSVGYIRCKQRVGTEPLFQMTPDLNHGYKRLQIENRQK